MESLVMASMHRPTPFVRPPVIDAKQLGLRSMNVCFRLNVATYQKISPMSHDRSIALPRLVQRQPGDRAQTERNRCRSIYSIADEPRILCSCMGNLSVSRNLEWYCIDFNCVNLSVSRNLESKGVKRKRITSYPQEGFWGD